MPSFELTKGQKNLQEMARWFAKEQLRPIALEADRTHHVPEDFLLRVQQMGISQGAIIEGEGLGTRSGGGGGAAGGGEKQTNRTSVVISEEMGYGDPAIVLTFPGPGLGGPPVRFMGTPEQRARFFGIFGNKDELHWGAYGLTEPGAGSDAAAIRTTARRDGDHYVLDGRKCYITNGGRADWVVIFATVDASQGRAGHRAFVVEKGTPGFEVGRIEEKMGLCASETAELVLDGARVPAENLLGGEEHYVGKEGFMGAMKTFDSTRPIVAAMAVGMARGALEEARRFFREHYETGRPIARYAALRDQLADDHRRIEAARLLCWRAGWMADKGIPNAKEASMAKAYAAMVAVRACSNAVALLGAHGALRGTIVEKFFRDIKVFDIFEGTGQIQRVVISKRLIPGLERF
jgi:acyl-CoA dehydrogenase